MLCFVGNLLILIGFKLIIGEIVSLKTVNLNTIEREVMGTIVNKSIEEYLDSDLEKCYRTQIECSYTVNNKQYQKLFSICSFSKLEQAEYSLVKYPVNGSITLFYHPKNPKRIRLSSFKQPSPKLTIVPSLIIILTGCVLNYALTKSCPNIILPNPEQMTIGSVIGTILAFVLMLGLSVYSAYNGSLLSTESLNESSYSVSPNYVAFRESKAYRKMNGVIAGIFLVIMIRLVIIALR